MASSINVNQNNNIVSLQDQNRKITITDNVQEKTVNITQPITNIVSVNSLGPQGTEGPVGPAGELTSYTNLSITGSLYVSGTSAGHITASGNISASGTLSGGGLNVYGTSNSHIELGEYNIGFDFAQISGYLVTGSGLIISGEMADANHHNFLKIGNVELVDITNAVHTNMFLIHNAGSFLISSGSDGGNLAANKLIEHTGKDFTMYTVNDAVIIQYINSTDSISVGKTGGTFIANASSTQLISPNTNETYVASRHVGVFDTNPDNTSTTIKSIPVDTFFTTVTGAVTASAVSASGTGSLGYLMLPNIPTSDPGVVGAVWREGTDLKVSVE